MGKKTTNNPSIRKCAMMKGSSKCFNMLMACAIVLGLMVWLGAKALGAVETKPALLDFSDAPQGFLPPPLHPEGVQLETRKLAEGAMHWRPIMGWWITAVLLWDGAGFWSSIRISTGRWPGRFWTRCDG